MKGIRCTAPHCSSTRNSRLDYKIARDFNENRLGCLMFYTDCISSKTFPAGDIPKWVAEVENKLKSIRRYKQLCSFRAKWSLQEPPTFQFVVPAPVNFDCFDPKRLDDVEEAVFVSKSMPCKQGATQYSRILDYLSSSKCKTALVNCDFENEHPLMMLKIANGIQSTFHPFSSLDKRSPEEVCQILNDRMGAIASIANFEPSYVVEGTAVRWKGGTSDIVQVFPPFLQDEKGDKVRIVMPMERCAAVSQAHAKLISDSDTNVVIEARMLVETSRIEGYLNEGPFRDGCFHFLIEAPISKPFQKYLMGTSKPIAGFCPAFEYLVKGGPCFHIGFLASDDLAQCVVGIVDEEEPWDAEVFKAFTNDAGLSPIFPT